MHLLISVFLYLSSLGFSNAFADEETVCTYSINADQVKVKWEAFKTPSKVAVEGQFQKIELKGETQGKSILEIVKTAKFKIDASTVESKNSERDKKIAQFFFSSMKGGSLITGQVSETTPETLSVNVSMNGVTKAIPMTYTFLNGNFRAVGVMDILDFAMAGQLKALTDACHELHKGKTWSDVNIELWAKFKKKCN